MKRNNKKGFTIVELVIVIAVIAILAAVLIPTFSGVIEKANVSATNQETCNPITNDLVEANADYVNIAETKANKFAVKHVSSLTLANNLLFHLEQYVTLKINAGKVTI